MADNSITVKTGGIVAGAGCLFGLAPLILVLGTVGSGAEAVGWYILFTAPAGAVVVIIGLIIAIVGALRKTPEDFVKSVVTVAEESTPPTPQIPRYRNWNINSRQVGLIFLLNIVASLIVITATIINVNVTVTASHTLLPLGVTVALQSIPVLLVGLLMWLAWQVKSASGTPAVKVHFARLERVQHVIGIASLLWVLPMSMFPYWFLGGETVGLGILAGYAPALTGIVASLVTLFVRDRIEVLATEEVADHDGR